MQLDNLSRNLKNKDTDCTSKNLPDLTRKTMN